METGSCHQVQTHEPKRDISHSNHNNDVKNKPTLPIIIYSIESLIIILIMTTLFTDILFITILSYNPLQLQEMFAIQQHTARSYQQQPCASHVYYVS